MAKITIAGDAVIITSALKLEDIRTIEKYRPESLTLMGGDFGDEPVFAICTTEGPGEINEHGASFSGATRDDEKLACITMCLEDEGTGEDDRDIREQVADCIGSAIINLNRLENLLPDVLTDIKSEKAEVMANITVLQ